MPSTAGPPPGLDPPPTGDEPTPTSPVPDGGDHRRSRLLAVAAVLLAVLGITLVGLAATRGPDLPGPAPSFAATLAVPGPATATPPSPSPSPSSEPATAPVTAPASTSASTSSSTSASTSETALAGLPPANPTQVRIPSIGVDAKVIHLGLAPDGTLQVPTEASPVGWFTGGPSPGEDGPAVRAGHVTYNSARGVFFALNTLQPGARIEVTRNGAPTAVFTVTAVSSFAKDTFPTGLVYGHTDGPELRLITCAGDYDTAHHSYPDNLVVFARLTSTQP